MSQPAGNGSHVFKSSGRNEPIRLIAGSGRSGTTWVLDVLAEANGLRPVFEPLHPLAIPDAAPFAYRYLRRTSEQPAARDFLSRVFDGSRHCWWTDYRVRTDRLKPRLKHFDSISSVHAYVRRWRKLYERYRRYGPAVRRPRLLVKCIRANLMIGWLRANFGARIALVLRHPGAVVESRLRLGGDDWEPRELLRRYLEQAELQEDYLFKYNQLLRSGLSPAESHTAIWCIENQLPLTQIASGEATVIAYYEHLLSGEVAAWRPLLEALALDQMPGPTLLARTSQSSAAHDSRRAHDPKDADRWRERLDPATLRQIGGMLQAMEVTTYDVDDPLPRPGNAGERLQRPADQSVT